MPISPGKGRKRRNFKIPFIKVTILWFTLQIRLVLLLDTDNVALLKELSGSNLLVAASPVNVIPSMNRSKDNTIPLLLLFYEEPALAE